MLELIVLVLFIWLFIKAVEFSIRLAWGAAKIVGSLLFILALPVLLVCLLFASGAVLIVPLVMVCVACGILKSR